MLDPQGKAVKRNFVHVEDLASAILAAIDNPAARQQTFNICMNEPVDYREVADYLAQHKGLPSVDIASPFHGTWLDNAMTSRFVTLTRYAIDSGAHGVLFTCSAFGACIETAARQWPSVPILKPNEAMIDQAVALTGSKGGRVALMASFRPTLLSMPPEFPSAIEVVPIFVEGAMDALATGRPEEHDRLVCAAAQRLDGIDVIALAQFSMARAAPAVRSVVHVPVVTAPGSAVTALKARLAR